MFGVLLDGDGDPAALRRVLGCVVEQVDQDLLDSVAIARGEGCPWGVQRHGNDEVGLQRLDHPARELGNVDPVVLDGDLAPVELAREQHLLGDLRQPLRLRRDHLEQLASLLGGDVDVRP